MQIRNVTITNELGLHARACAKIVQVANRFPCEVSLVAKGRRANAHNILALMLLSASVGSVLRVEIDGPEEARAMSEIAALFHNGFGKHS